MWTASKLSRFCAHHNLLSDLHPRPTRDKAAAKGSLFHQALLAWWTAGFVPPIADDDVEEWLRTMVEYGWTWPDGVELEVAWGLSHWGTFVPVKETTPHVYESIDGEDLLTAGRADACWVTNGMLVVVDWKTGRSMAPMARENLQVNAAGIALTQKWKCDSYMPGIYYARSGAWDMGDEATLFPLEALPVWEEIKRAAKLDDQPHPGEHCSSCWERKHCSAA